MVRAHPKENSISFFARFFWSGIGGFLVAGVGCRLWRGGVLFLVGWWKWQEKVVGWLIGDWCERKEGEGGGSG